MLEHQLRLVVDLAQMGKEHDLQRIMVDALQQFEGFRIGKVAVATADALFQGQRVGAVEEKIGVMVGFQNQTMTPLKPRPHQLGGNPEVRADPEPVPIVLEDEPGRVLGIVGNGKRLDPQVADHERITGLEQLDVGQLSNLRGQPVERSLAEIDGEVKAPAQGPQSAHMIGVLMTDDDGIEVVGPDAGLLQAENQLLGAEAGIQEDPRLLTADQDGVSLGPAGEGLKEEGHEHLSIKKGVCQLTWVFFHGAEKHQAHLRRLVDFLEPFPDST